MTQATGVEGMEGMEGVDELPGVTHWQQSATAVGGGGISDEGFYHSHSM
jgi:hypothetical protein